jgi:acetoacetyl-CoA synthetase|tara:strand:+ start:13297 stop:15300 length:2004 start_codon:yes stop_codon:yes gene_type:complete
MINEGQFLWRAPRHVAQNANITKFSAWLKSNRNLDLPDYPELWDWSVDDSPAFWQAIWDYFDIQTSGEIEQVRTGDPMPQTRWFTGTRLNYAEHVLRHETNGDPARTVLQHCSEIRDLAEMSWADLGAQVRQLATNLRAMEIGPGDRVVAYMPNIVETVVAMLATTAIGAIWSSAAPEFGAQTVIDRFSQIKPKLVFAVNGYRYGGKDFDRSDQIQNIVAALPSVERVVMLDYLPDAKGRTQFDCPISSWSDVMAGDGVAAETFEFERVDSDHPLWILFSSGTTGLPKPIVHGHHGIVVEHYKSAAFHFDLHEGDCLFFYSTTGWMMWNTLMWGPLMNAQAVLYDGHPAHPGVSFLFELADKSGATVFGTNPTFTQLVRQQGYVPEEHFAFERLKSVMLVGSPATPEAFDWVYKNVKDDVWVTSQSGGTEFCSGILAGAPTLPVQAGVIQAPALGVDVRAFDAEGNIITGEIGELVLRQPMPSLPLFFWGDEGNARYNSSYFEDYPGIWKHGDRVKFNADGSCFVYGRSDATLNRFGVRIGSAEIYRTLETFSEVIDSLVVCIEEPAGGFYMPLFVEMAPGKTLDEVLITAIRARLRKERSPRHVPDQIIAVPAIPNTLTGKKMEIPIRKLLMGATVDEVISKGAMKDPSVIDWYADFARTRQKEEA